MDVSIVDEALATAYRLVAEADSAANRGDREESLRLLREAKRHGNRAKFYLSKLRTGRPN